MQKVKKIPQRQCVGCREMKDKRALIRAVKSPQGEVSLDFTGKKPGRGAYVCPNSECLKMCIRDRKLTKSEDMPVLDRWLITKLNELMVKAEQSYCCTLSLIHI